MMFPALYNHCVEAEHTSFCIKYYTTPTQNSEAGRPLWNAIYTLKLQKEHQNNTKLNHMTVPKSILQVQSRVILFSLRTELKMVTQSLASRNNMTIYG